MSDNEPRVLRPHGTAGQHPLEEFAQGGVDAGFGLAALVAGHRLLFLMNCTSHGLLDK